MKNQKSATQRWYQRLKADPVRWAKFQAKQSARRKAQLGKRREWGRAYEARHRKERPEVHMLKGAKKRASRKGLDFSLHQVHLHIPQFCPVLGIRLDWHDRGSAPSLDRFDNTKGYTPDNVRIISYRANALKRDGTLEEFRQLVLYMEGKL